MILHWRIRTRLDWWLSKIWLIRTGSDSIFAYLDWTRTEKNCQSDHLCYLSVILAPFGTVFGYFGLKKIWQPCWAQSARSGLLLQSVVAELSFWYFGVAVQYVWQETSDPIFLCTCLSQTKGPYQVSLSGHRLVQKYLHTTQRFTLSQGRSHIVTVTRSTSRFWRGTNNEMLKQGTSSTAFRYRHTVWFWKKCRMHRKMEVCKKHQIIQLNAVPDISGWM